MLSKEEIIALDNEFLDAKLVLSSFEEPMKTAKETLADLINAVQQKWNNENAELLQSYETAFLVVETIEKKLRTAVVDSYNEQADKTIKTVIPGWGVRVDTKLEYTPTDAIAWAVEHKHLHLLKLDIPAFKKIATVLKPDFVTFQEEVTARIEHAEKGK